TPEGAGSSTRSRGETGAPPRPATLAARFSSMKRCPLMLSRWPLYPALACLLLASACRRAGGPPGPPPGPAPPPQRGPAPAAPSRREAWASLPPDRWPQLVLTNDATFKGHTPHKGASSFLLRGPDGRTFLATARHLLGPDGGVRPEVTMPAFDAVLVAWKAHP